MSNGIMTGRMRKKFWGVSCIGGKAYKQAENYGFRLTMAALDPKSYDSCAPNKIVTVNIIHNNQAFHLCTLKHGEIYQVNLDLAFDKEDDVTFSINGRGTVILTGYQLVDEDDESNCPVAEIKSGKQTNTVRFMNCVETVGGSSDEEDDSDFSVKFDEMEEDSVEEDLSDEECNASDIEAAEIQDLLKDGAELYEEPEDTETPVTPEGSKSQKRKKEKELSSQKRAKKENLNSESPRQQNVSMKSNKVDSGESNLDSSIGNTPMPSTKTKKKNKKRLSEISNLDKSKKADDTLPNHHSTPKQSENKSRPIVQVDGGVEYQDYVVGRGPTATPGKVVSIFYIGRLADKTIFDSRVAPKKPYTFKLGVPEVIKGLDIGIRGMKVGGQRKLKVPPKMGYGSKKVNEIPPDSILYFTIELVSVN